MVELLCRSNFSLLQGASHPEELVAAAHSKGLTHVGVVDRDGVYGLPRAHKAAKDEGIHLVCGATITLRDRPPVSLLVLAREGWKNLCRLISDARSTVEKGRAELDPARLVERASGLWCVLRPGWSVEAADSLREGFEGRLSVALTRQLQPGDRRRTWEAEALAAGLGAPLLASNDVLYHEPQRKRVADVLTGIRRSCTLEQAGLALGANAERHLLGPQELKARFADHPEALFHADDVAARCTFSLDELKYAYPREVVPDGWTPIGWLEKLVEDGLLGRYPAGVPDTVRAQVKYELGVITQLDFPAYFLTVFDIVRFARSRGILCQGRGSAANSAVCYALGITAVDPSRASMLFERFISVERGEPPDIDVDFEHERREEVIQYVYERYGRDRAALVDEVIAYRGRSAIRDAGKVFGLSLDQVDRLAKGTDRWSAGDSSVLADLIREVGMDPADAGVQSTMSLAHEMSGFPRHLSIHVGGFTITEDPLIELVPIEPATMEARTVIQWDKDDIDVMGFVKVDVLGLGMLTAIRKAFELVESFSGQRWTLATVPAEDPAVYDMFCKADTVGVFQIESRAQMSMLPRLLPRCFYDLVVEVAIVRPGPIQGGMVHPFLRRRRGEEAITYAHPALVPILERTLGVPLFQEQVMAMAIAVGGFTAGQADNLRRAMGAWRKRGKLDEIGQRLVRGMIERGITPEYAQAIYAQILGFGEYGFPESHAASFALLVYVSGWLKCHTPAAFAAALINSQPMGFYSPRSLLADAQRHGIEVRPVTLEDSAWDCTLEPAPGSGPEQAAIRCGFRLIRGFGEADAKALIAERDRAPFTSVAELARRTGLDRGALRALADAGALTSLTAPRRQAAWELQGLWTDLPLFTGIARREPAAELPEETPMEALEADYRAVGLSVGQHPVGLMRGQLERDGVLRLEMLAGRPPGAPVRIVGLVTCRQRPGTANGVVFMTLEDETAMVNLVIWPKIWAAFRKVARDASILGAEGRLQREGGALSVLVDRFWKPDGLTIGSVSRDFH
jgi:error-prone DNA polymerase